jgi:hypothetical protein
MTPSKRLAMIFLWWVMTFQGQRVAGPFTTLGDCQPAARYMAQRYTNVSSVCVWR